MLDNPHIDYALVVLFVFLGFFIGLLLYLRREDRREGYPLEEDGGRLQPAGTFVFTADPKSFHLSRGRGTIMAPSGRRDQRPLAATRSVVPGSPLVPTGDPMLAGVGPGAYAERAHVPDLTAHGDPKIVPISLAHGFKVIKGDADPRGMAVVGADGHQAGVVDDLWVDRVESIIRYLQIKRPTGTSIVVPMTMATVSRKRRTVTVDAITAAQFDHVPTLARPDQITFDEEERVSAYYGAGYLYATKARAESAL